jgi:hypothetical protein
MERGHVDPSEGANQPKGSIHSPVYKSIEYLDSRLQRAALQCRINAGIVPHAGRKRIIKNINTCHRNNKLPLPRKPA